MARIRGGRFDGFGSVLEMLGVMDSTQRDALLLRIQSQDPAMAQRLRDQLLIFEDLQFLEGNGLAKVLQEVPTPKLVLALRTASPALLEAVYKNLSQRAGKVLAEELADQGPKPKADVQKAQREIVEIAKRQLESGQLELKKGQGR